MIPLIETERLVLREPRLADFDSYAAFWASDRATENGFGGPYDRNAAWDSFIGEAGQWTIRGLGSWMVEEKSSGKAAGWIGFYYPDRYEEIELGWTLFAEFEGRGIAFEGAIAAREFGQSELGVKAPASFITVENTRSIRLAERLGAKLEDTRDRGNGPFHVYRHPFNEDLK